MNLPISLHRGISANSLLLQVILTIKKNSLIVRYEIFHGGCTYLTYLIFCPEINGLKIMIFFWVKLSPEVRHKSILIRKMNPTWGGINIQCFHKMAIIWHCAIKFTHCNYSLHYFDWCIKNFFNTHGILILIIIYLLFKNILCEIGE